MKKTGLISVVSIISLLSGFSTFAHQLTLDTQLNNQPSESINASPISHFTFSFPEIELIDQRNQPQALGELFEKDKNVVFAFFFSHCVSVCTTTTLSLKSILPDLPPDTTIAMISIDPDTDTPELLQAYARSYGITESNWFLLTGDNKQIVDLQKSFEAYRGNKMNHTTSIFIKKAHSDVVTEIKNNFSVIPKLLVVG